MNKLDNEVIKITKSFLEIIECKDRRLAGKTAGPTGLVLVEVNYN